ncbi:MAG: DUF983 domain-containing protein [Actinobacteria bacterium]|jgi:uncharacterized protein (DUF983 family)|nr:DUF983 domain-containing protein [Actinomycetota bacterium]
MANLSLITAVARGLRKRCPRCGGKGIFRSWGQLKDACPTCGYTFVREEGYWVGAVIVNTAVAMVSFFVLFIGTILLTLPDIPWALLLGIALGSMGLIPVVFYPTSKTLWMSLHVHFNPGADTL